MPLPCCITAVSAGLGWVASYINKKLNRKIARKTQHMLYFWKVEGSRMSNMTFPCVNTIQLGRNPFNSSPQCKKSSLRHHFRRNSWKLGSQKLQAHQKWAWNSNFCEPNFQEFRLKWWRKELFLHCGDELNGLRPSWMVLTHGNVIFDIPEPSAFQKYSICWVF